MLEEKLKSLENEEFEFIGIDIEIHENQNKRVSNFKSSKKKKKELPKDQYLICKIPSVTKLEKIVSLIKKYQDSGELMTSPLKLFRDFDIEFSINYRPYSSEIFNDDKLNENEYVLKGKMDLIQELSMIYAESFKQITNDINKNENISDSKTI